MSDNAGTDGASYMRDSRYVKPSTTTPVVITSYRALIACNGDFDFGLREKKILEDEDAWSTILNFDESNQEGKDADKNWKSTVSNKHSKKRSKK